MVFILILIVIALLSFAVIGLGIRILLKKNATFSKSCSVKDPVTGKVLGCTCNNNGDKNCKNYDIHTDNANI